MRTQNPIDVDRVDVLPILPSLDFSVTRAFYVDQLGFEEIEGICEDYVLFRRGSVELHFWLCPDPMISMNSSVYFRTDMVDALFDEYAGREVDGLRRAADEDEGIHRFHVHDPHGNLLIFGRRETAAL